MHTKKSIFLSFSLCLAWAQLLLAQPADFLKLDLIREHDSRNQGRMTSLDEDSTHSYDMLSLFLEYRVEAEEVPMAGTASITLAGLEDQPIIKFNAERMSILNVSYFDQNLQFVQQNDTLYVIYSSNRR